MNINMRWRVWREQCKAVVKLDLLWHIRRMAANISEGVFICRLRRGRRRWRWDHIAARLYTHIMIEQGLGINHHLCAIIEPIFVIAGVRLHIIECAIGIMKMGNIRERGENRGMSLGELAREVCKCSLGVQVAP